MTENEINKEILSFLTEGEKTTRQIQDHLSVEVGGENEWFPRSTTWYHLVTLLNSGKIKQRTVGNRSKSYWSVIP
jgi:predicted transcriptional regulator